MIIEKRIINLAVGLDRLELSPATYEDAVSTTSTIGPIYLLTSCARGPAFNYG